MKKEEGVMTGCVKSIETMAKKMWQPWRHQAARNQQHGVMVSAKHQRRNRRPVYMAAILTIMRRNIEKRSGVITSV